MTTSGPMDRIPDAAWRTSTYSGSNGGECVQVADRVPGVVPVRDSKDPAGPVLAFGHGAFAAFVGALRRAELPAS
ncbi:DUF397 domain-containing protein [Streptomyces fuscigenes]|uniref:DUF397 domain-containing protein n=1 Tax=Streptomyces fuscigenes TaxID=1528880 RepID=UPI001F159F60|nr:DUF397 domain-containing protein [Streptomyces fuscigenes]MCF3961073.1 DUF397 domain-containing protein [Streptomyces fuscigenes]